MSDKKVKGSVINGYLKFVGKTWGREGLEKCLADTKLAGIEIKDGVKYSNNMLLEVIRWISHNYGLDSVRKAGQHAVKNLGLLSYIVRFTSIKTMLEKSKDAYHETYDSGEVSIVIKDKHAVAYMKDVSVIPENCIGWVGALEALLEITRTKGTVTKTKCQLKGDPRCEYEVRWD